MDTLALFPESHSNGSENGDQNQPNPDSISNSESESSSSSSQDRPASSKRKNLMTRKKVVASKTKTQLENVLRGSQKSSPSSSTNPSPITSPRSPLNSTQSHINETVSLLNESGESKLLIQTDNNNLNQDSESSSADSFSVSNSEDSSISISGSPSAPISNSAASQITNLNSQKGKNRAFKQIKSLLRIANSLLSDMEENRDLETIFNESMDEKNTIQQDIEDEFDSITSQLAIAKKRCLTNLDSFYDLKFKNITQAKEEFTVCKSTMSKAIESASSFDPKISNTDEFAISTDSLVTCISQAQDLLEPVERLPFAKELRLAPISTLVNSLHWVPRLSSKSFSVTFINPLPSEFQTVQRYALGSTVQIAISCTDENGLTIKEIPIHLKMAFVLLKPRSGNIAIDSHGLITDLHLAHSRRRTTRSRGSGAKPLELESMFYSPPTDSLQGANFVPEEEDTTEELQVISFTPSTVGEYKIKITCNDKDIPGSPFNVLVTKLPNMTKLIYKGLSKPGHLLSASHSKAIQDFKKLLFLPYVGTMHAFPLAWVLLDIASDSQKPDPEQEHLCRALIFALDSIDGIETFLCSLLTHEIESQFQNKKSEAAQHNANATLFRKNTMTTKLMKHLSIYLGIPYLVFTLKDYIDQVMQVAEMIDKKNGSLDPTDIDCLAQFLFDSILTSVGAIPVELRGIYHHIYTSVEKFLPEAAFRAVGSFFFLRFLCAGCAMPDIYGVLDPSYLKKSRNLRTCLVKVVKLITNLANEVSFSGNTKKDQIFNEFLVRNKIHLPEFYSQIMNIDDFPEEQGRALQRSPQVLENSLVYLYNHLVENQIHLSQCFKMLFGTSGQDVLKQTRRVISESSGQTIPRSGESKIHIMGKKLSIM